MLCLSVGITLGSFGLTGDKPFSLHGFFRPDTALAFAPALADLLTCSVRLPWSTQEGDWQAASAVALSPLRRLPALMRRVVASIAIAVLTTKTSFEGRDSGDNSGTLWT